MVFQMASAATSSWPRAHLVMYLADDVTTASANDIRSSLMDMPAVASAEYVGSEAAMERFAAALGRHDDLLEGLEPTFLPASIEVTLRPGLRPIATLTPVVERLRGNPEIADVEFTDDWVEQSAAIQRALDRAHWLALLFVLIACGYLVTAAISARFDPRLREAAVARLFGASTAFVRAPLIVEGAIQGVLGAGLAILAVWLFLDAAGPGIGAVLGPVAAAEMAMPTASRLFGFVGAGAALGMVGTWLATRRHANA